MSTTNKKQLEFTAKNVKSLTGWLKRFSLIDKTLLLEIDLTTSKFLGKTYNEERSVVKFSKIKFDEAGLTLKPSKETKRIKVGLFNIPNLIKVMDQFNDAEFNVVFEYQELMHENVAQFVAEKIVLKNKSLKISVDCTSLNIFNYISDELFTGSIASADAIGTFELPKTAIDKINNLNGLDSDNKFMQFYFKDNETYVSGKTYELLIGDIKSTDAELTLFKDQYASLDGENYSVDLADDRLVFTSKDSDTVCVISRAENKD